MTVIKLKSQIDASVNNVIDGAFETRFVTRGTEAIIYLSSFKGCDQACRMCHLTQNGLTDMTPASIEDFVRQAHLSLADAMEHFINKGEKPEVVHFNFMARGEPLLNETIMKKWPELSEKLLEASRMFFGEGMPVKFKISTIGTGIYERNADGVIVGGYQDLPFEVNRPDVYYSLYSLDKEFRKRWLPKAEDPAEFLRLLSRYVRVGGGGIIHGAFIRGHNDEFEDITKMVNAIQKFPLLKRFNIVRFNSPDTSKWNETDEEYLLEIEKYLVSRGLEVQMVPRVGEDIFASCGTFMVPQP